MANSKLKVVELAGMTSTETFKHQQEASVF